MSTTTPNYSKNPSKKIPGTKTSLQNSQLLISSGIPSLDHVIGGGIPIGSIFLIEEDEYAKYSNVMMKYYLSEAIVCNHKLFVATLECDSQKLITELPTPTNVEPESTTKPQDDQMNNDMKIAWRYNNLSMVESGINSSLQFGHYFDLATPMNDDVLSKVDIVHWKLPNQTDDENINVTGNRAYENVLISIKNVIKNGNFNKSDPGVKDNILRIGIPSLGSPHWQRYENHNTKNQDVNEGKCIVEFIYKLRAILRSTYAVVLLTIPTHLFENPNIVAHIRHSVDGCIKLDSFAGTERESNPALRDYHGLFYMPKIMSNNLLAPYVPATLDLAFKLRRKKFLIEKLHLPPELQDSSEREQDDGSSVGCGSAKQKNLDF